MRKLIVVAALAALLAGCVGLPVGDQVKGSGNMKTETRQVSDFDSIEVSGAYKVEVTNGKGGTLEIEADDNLLPLIKTEVSGRRLRITNERGFNTQTLPRVRLSVPDLKEANLSGASDFSLKGLSNERFKLDSDGAGKFRAEGETGTFEVSLDGAGVVDARELHARIVKAVTNGAGSITVYATDSLDATVNGVGTIDYYGDPKTVNPQVNGVGKITKK